MVIFLIGVCIVIGFLPAVISLGLVCKFRMGWIASICIIVIANLIEPWFVFNQLYPLANSEAQELYEIWAIIVPVVFAIISIAIRYRTAIVYPHCKSLDSYTVVKVLSQDDYYRDQDFKKNIYDKEGNTIGAYDVTKTVHACAELTQLKCKNCGKTFNVWFEHIKGIS